MLVGIAHQHEIKRQALTGPIQVLRAQATTAQQNERFNGRVERGLPLKTPHIFRL